MSDESISHTDDDVFTEAADDATLVMFTVPDPVWGADVDDEWMSPEFPVLWLDPLPDIDDV